jgi:hypothetical protein
MIKKLLTIIFVLFPCIALGQSESCRELFIENGDVFINVKIQGKEYRAALTTSNIGTSISKGLVRELGLTSVENRYQQVISDFGEPTNMRFVRELDIEIFGTVLNAKNVVMTQGEAPWMSITLRAFENYLLQLDFPKKRICFFSRDAVDLKELQNVDFDDDAEYGVPIVRVKLNGIDTWLDFSPGYADSLLVDSVLAKELGLYEQERAEGYHSGDTLPGTVKRLTFGPYELDDVDVRFPKPDVKDNLTTNERSDVTTRIKKGAKSRGRIGMGVLRHFTLTFDLKSERMHIYAE